MVVVVMTTTTEMVLETLVQCTHLTWLITLEDSLNLVAAKA
jgi:hypothetical protein